jgi:hypothetical protein
MAIIEPHSQINPADDANRGESEVVIQPIPLPRDGGSARRPRSRHRAEDRSWPATLERILRSWPTTLRTALLLAVVLLGIAAVAAASGLAGPLLFVAGGYQARRWLHRDGRRESPD